MRSLKGENLIFIISQPRAGSTLLQRILASHAEIHSKAEPWLMFNPLYALRSKGHEAEYNSDLACTALQNFIDSLPNTKDDYFEGVRRMCTHLYECALVGSGKRYFVDKTPRYYFIIPELYRSFPKAHYIFLLRNPLAVLHSIVETWLRTDWLSLFHFKHDLIQAPRFILDGMRTIGEESIVVQYEQLVEDANSEVKRICESIGLVFIPDMINYGDQQLARWPFGDQEKLYGKTHPDQESVNKWVRRLDDPQIWRLMNEYLNLLGWEIVEQMGYPFDDLQKVIEKHRPRRRLFWLTFPLLWLVEKPLELRERVIFYMVRLARSLRNRGLWGTAAAAVESLVHLLSNSSRTRLRNESKKKKPF